MNNARDYLLQRIQCDENDEKAKLCRDDIIAIIEKHYPDMAEEDLPRILALVVVWPWTNWGMVVLYLASQRKRNAAPFDAAVGNWDNAVGTAITKVLSENEVPRTVRHEDAMVALRQATENIFARIGDRTARIVTIDSLYRVLSTHDRDRPKPLWVPTDADKEVDPLKSLYAESQKAGMLVFDRMLFDEIDNTGEKGRGYVERLKNQSLTAWGEFTGQQPCLLPEAHPDVWYLWTAPDNRALDIVANVAWHDIVKPALDRAKQPAAPTLFLEPFVRSLASGGQRDKEAQKGAYTLVENRTGVPGIPDNLLDELENVGPFHDRTGMVVQRLLRGLLAQAAKERLRNLTQWSEAAPVLVFEGWRGLAKSTDISPKKHKELKEAVLWGASTVVFDMDGAPRGSLWSIPVKPELTTAPGRSARLVLQPNGFFLHPQQEAFVPLPSRLPPLVGERRNFLKLANLQLLELVEFRNRGPELFERGSVHMDARARRLLADKARVPVKLMEELHDRLWLENAGDGTPAFLQRVSPDRYTLAQAYSRELDVLMEGSRRSYEGRRQGLASAAKRASPKRNRRMK